MNAQARIRGWITRDPIAAAFVLLTVPLYAAAILVSVSVKPWGGYIAALLLGFWVFLALVTGFREQSAASLSAAQDRPVSRLERTIRFVAFVVPCGLWIYGFFLQRTGGATADGDVIRDGAVFVLIVTHVIWIVVDWTLQQRFNARSTAP